MVIINIYKRVVGRFNFMPLSVFEQGAVIADAGQVLENFYFITKGSVQASFDGQVFSLGPGDAIGLSALEAGIYTRSYKALSEVNVFSGACGRFGDLHLILRDNADMAARLVSSVCRQTSELLQFHLELKSQADRAFALTEVVYPQYEAMCARFAFASKKLPGLEEAARPVGLDSVEDCLFDYYTEIKNLDNGLLKSVFGSTGIALGFVYKAALDFNRVLEACGAYQTYLRQITKVFLNQTGFDFFGLLAELHAAAAGIKDGGAAVKGLMKPLVDFLSASSFVDVDIYRMRVQQYRESMAAAPAVGQTTAPAAGAKQNLSDSLSVILEYSGCDEELSNKFTRSVHEFTKLTDRGSTDDVAYMLRRGLTPMFYDIYKGAFLKSLQDSAVPTIIKMFLNFGYVDADLAGHENANYLYSIADSLQGDAGLGVYTISEWLAAVYNGDKPPSRNDFDEDYPAFVRDMRVSGKIDEKEEARLLNDGEQKLLFEMEHVFPAVNKITFGRMATFTPLFSDSDVQRSLPAALVKPADIREIINEIRGIDFSAYTREVLYSNSDLEVPKETVRVEFLPDFILMPNAGTRGVMWQEIEGRKRTSPSRMFLPLFLMDDLKTWLMRLTAEFRWEMCKRMQGARWNDLSDPSLTSEFFDYLQFYRGNRELSPEVKSTVKAELLRARNVYKAVFVSNYADWLMYESKGSPRLNKYVRRILFNYCPFVKEVREKLGTNPQYADILKQYEFKRANVERRLGNVIQKIGNLNRGPVPQELLDEMEFVRR